MVQRLALVALAACAFALGGPSPAVSSQQDPAASGGHTATRTVEDVANAAASRATAVLGTAWHADNSPLPYAKVRLRSTLTGRLAAHAVADEGGHFSFHSVETGSYLIELVSDSGKVLAVGHAFTLGPGETLATFIRLGPRVPWFAGFFSNAAAAVASSAAAVGVTAVAPETMRPVSRTR
jgi:hypothetical protein